MIKNPIQLASRPAGLLAVVVLFCLISLFIFPAASLATSSELTSPALTSSASKVDAKAIYDHWCAQCHGYEGRADGINSTPDMAINPRDHTDRNFMVTRSDDQFEDVIRGGGTRAAKSPLMPPWEHTLTDAEIKSLVAYLRVLCKCEYEGVVSHKKLRGVDPDFK